MTSLGEWLDRYCAPDEEPTYKPRSQKAVEADMKEELDELA